MAVYNNPTYQALFAQQHCGLQPVPIGNGNYILNPASLRDSNYSELWESLNQVVTQQATHGIGKNIRISFQETNYYDSLVPVPVNTDTLFNGGVSVNSSGQ